MIDEVKIGKRVVSWEKIQTRLFFTTIFSAISTAFIILWLIIEKWNILTKILQALGWIV